MITWDYQNNGVKSGSKFLSHFGGSWAFLEIQHILPPQTNGQTEVTNSSLGNLLRSYVGKNLKQWDLILLQNEFAYNRFVHQTFVKSPFEVVYGL